MSLRNHISASKAPWSSLTIYFGTLFGLIGITMIAPYILVNWLRSISEVSLGFVVLIAYSFGMAAVLAGNKLERQSEWLRSHIAWAQSWMDTLSYPLRGDKDT